MDEELIKRIRRLYAAVGATVETDMNQLPAHVICTEEAVGFFQDFRGTNTPEELENALHTLIAIVASLEYHLRRWAHHNGHDPDQVTASFKDTRSLQIIHDLWNAEKHTYNPTRGSDRSGIAPQLKHVRRIMQLRTQPKAGSFVMMTISRSGLPLVHGDGTATGVVTGEVISKDGIYVGEVHDLLAEAVGTCEKLMLALGIQLPCFTGAT